MKDKTASPLKFTLQVPGSTSNLGPGFDTLGLAVSIYNTVTFTLEEQAHSTEPVTLSDGTDTHLPLDASNHIYRTLANALCDDELLKRVRVHIKCDIPVGRGLGSSGTATLAAIWAADLLRGRIPDPERVLEHATKVEGHPDNVSPSLLGGFTVSGVSSMHGLVLVERLIWPHDWETLFVVPGRQLNTADARAVLPAQVAFKDAVHNVQRVSLLLAAISSRDEEMMTHALEDKLHQPYRAHLIPELEELQLLTRGTGAFGCSLSGAGPSVMITANAGKMGHVCDVVQEWANRQSPPPRVLRLPVDHEGLKQIDD